MAEPATLARPYAEAVARMAREGGNWQAWSDMLAAVVQVAAEPQVAALVGNPLVAGERVAGIIIAVCGGRLTADGANLVHLLAENKRLASLPEIARLFEDIRAAQEGVLAARIETALPLSDEQMARLAKKLEARFGRRIDAVQAVDASLVAGVVIRVGDEVLDASARGKLAEIAATLKA